MVRRKNRSEPAEPTPAAAAVSAEQLLAVQELAALKARLDELDQSRRGVDMSPVAIHRRERAEWLTNNTRTDHAAPCPACGLVGGEQRLTGRSASVLASAWLCAPCGDAVEIGWGESSRRIPAREDAFDRLACLAAGMDEPTRSFRALAVRYGLKFALARDSRGGDGTPWSHLSEPARWLEVGVKAVRRDAAGMGVFPVVDPAALEQERVLGKVYDPSSPTGSRTAYVSPESEPPAAEELAAQLAAEELAVEQALTAQAAAAQLADKERAAQAVKDAERARIDREYRAARQAQEALFEEHRRKLRDTRQEVLRAADTKADFNAIVRGI